MRIPSITIKTIGSIIPVAISHSSSLQGSSSCLDHSITLLRRHFLLGRERKMSITSLERALGHDATGTSVL